MSDAGGAARILVLVSGNGTNLQALLDAEKRGGLGGAVISGVLSDRSGVYALERARAAGVPAWTFPRGPDLSDRILSRARDLKADVIVLAGFLSILAGTLIEAYAGRMVNLHPSLLPKFGGKGMHGLAVHRAVLAAGEKLSGCTAHLVTRDVDAGEILLARTVPVLPDDTPERLADRVRAEEHAVITAAVKRLVAALRATAGGLEAAQPPAVPAWPPVVSEWCNTLSGEQSGCC
ncbi:MAG: phosphoribosylglycinamide formyltransferase [Spirochaetaceae bacterium]|nr:phosphoribosylglycinamide formyltransferase [Spirochaetaceae bacterium]